MFPLIAFGTHYSGVDCSAIVSSEGNHDIRAQYGIPREALLLGTVANLLPLKGYEVMLDALPAILSAVSGVHYLIIGSGDAEYCARLKAITVERGIAERVHFAGFQESVDPYLSAMDLYVHPSLKEAFGLAVVEAMAMGKAVVATTTGGLPEVVAQGETGLLVPPGDAESLAAAVVSLLEDRVRREQMGLCGKARAQERFSLDASVRQMEQLYGEVLGDRRGEDENRFRCQSDGGRYGWGGVAQLPSAPYDAGTAREESILWPMRDRALTSLTLWRAGRALSGSSG